MTTEKIKQWAQDKIETLLKQTNDVPDDYQYQRDLGSLTILEQLLELLEE